MGLKELLGLADWTQVSNYLREHYLDNPDEKKRREHCARLARLYENRSERDLNVLIEAAFKSEVNRDLRKCLVQWSKWNNVTARIVSEKATVYSAPAQRTVGEDDETYQGFLELIPMDEIMREADTKLALFEQVWIQYRVRVSAGDELEPLVDLIDPSSFWAVHSPKDKTELVAVIIDQSPGVNAKMTDAHYLVWCDTETVQLDARFRVMTETVAEWPIGKMPGLLASMVPPSATQRLLSQEPSADLAAAHDAVSFQNLLLLKESKSVNRQTYASGDVSRAAMGQVADTERMAVLPEGVVTTSVDQGVDLEQFRENAREIVDAAGANHGLPPALLHHEGASSGAEIELRRVPLRELRRKRIPIFRRIERRLCQIQSLVNAVDFKAAAFSAEGFTIDFGEVDAILTEQERDTIFEKRRQLLLTDTVEEERRRNPDLRTNEEAIKRIEARVQNEVMRVALTQVLSKMNGSSGSTPDEQTAEENGADGREETLQ
jgi:hypothetical protein